jgi:hypothetical protein
MLRFGLCIILSLSVAVGLPGGVSAQDSVEEEDSSNDLFLFAPETPEQLVQAVVIAQRVGRPFVAQRYMRQLVNPLPVTEDLIALRKRFGIGFFLDLYSQQDLQPEAKQLLAAINDASVQSVPSELRVQQLLEQPGDDPRSRAASILEILSANNTAVPALLAADPATAAGRLANTLLITHARDYRHGLFDQLAHSEDVDRIRILKLLGTVADMQLIDGLLRWQFGHDVSPDVSQRAAATIAALAMGTKIPSSREDAVATLSDRIHSLLRAASTRFGTQDIAADQSRLPSDPERTAMVERARSLAEDLVVITQGNETSLVLQLTTTLAAKQDVQARDVLAANLLDAALQTSMAANQHAATIEALQLMKARFEDNPDNLPDGKTLVEALVSSDVRVRIAAGALLTQTGQSDRAVGAVRRQAMAVAAGSFLPEAVVIDPRETERADLVTTLRDAGFEVQGSATGAAGFDAAVLQLQCDLIVVHANCQRWPLTLCVANLRADARTTGVPIVVFGPKWSRNAVRRLAKNYDGVWFIEEPVTELTLFERLGWLNVPGPVLAPGERQQLKSARLGFATVD